jgi:hypothetical protein
MLKKVECQKLVEKIRRKAADLTLTAGDPNSGSRPYREGLLDLADGIEEAACMIEREAGKTFG